MQSVLLDIEDVFTSIIINTHDLAHIKKCLLNLQEACNLMFLSHFLLKLSALQKIG
jgi:hypothetical protein